MLADEVTELLKVAGDDNVEEVDEAMAGHSLAQDQTDLLSHHDTIEVHVDGGLAGGDALEV